MLRLKLWWTNIRIYIIKEILSFQESMVYVKDKLEKIHKECIDRILNEEN